MSKLEVIALGVGDTFSERHRTSSLLLVCDGVYLAVDCPDVYRSVLKNAAGKSGRDLDISSIDHFLITHVHGDHMNGLEGVAWYKHFAEGKPVQLLTIPEVAGVIWEERLRVSMGVLWDGQVFKTMQRSDFFQDVPLNWGEETVVGPYRIRVRRTKHHVPTCAIRVEAGGRVLGYSSDTAFDPELLEWLSTADLIIHETNLGPAHTAYSDLAGLPAQLRQKMRLIHYPDFFDVADSVIPVLSEGEVVEV